MIDSESPVPPFHQLKGLLAARIASGQMVAGTKLTTRGLAEAYRLDKNTANRAIASLAADGLVEVIRGRGSFVTRQSPPPKKARPPRTECLGIFLSDHTRDHPFSLEVVRGLESQCKRSGYDLKLCLITQQEAEVCGCLAQARMVRQRGVDGIVLLMGHAPDAEIRLLAQEGIPIVLIHNRVPGLSVSSVRTDFRKSATELTDHLVALGHTRIAFLGARLHRRVEGARLEAHEAALDKHGLPRSAEMVKDASYDTSEVRRCVGEWLSLPDRPTAIMAGDDNMAADAIQFLYENGINVPRDMSVVGHNDMPIAQRTHPTLTTANIPMFRIGQIAARTLVAEIEENVERSELMLEPSLVVRDSTGPNLNARHQ